MHVVSGWCVHQRVATSGFSLLHACCTLLHPMCEKCWRSEKLTSTSMPKQMRRRRAWKAWTNGQNIPGNEGDSRKADDNQQQEEEQEQPKVESAGRNSSRKRSSENRSKRRSSSSQASLPLPPPKPGMHSWLGKHEPQRSSRHWLQRGGASMRHKEGPESKLRRVLDSELYHD